ncbi:hypothetical protein J7399_11725 [Shimia sp. R9_1]|uniref:hypothetical protein n=1 Tax=Shimia sp. R9_1 TaxID=2821111 RepID=UPI001ADAF324|nr:hypothetical protein [Shimia sp. R9_1]MBO9408101.1 hypothetical protein [Shimia sp. R9_1]
MEDLIWYAFLMASFALGFCFVWGMLVFGLTQRQAKEGTKGGEAAFVLRGNKRSKICIALIVVMMIYVVVTGAFDSVFFAALTLGFGLGASAIWSVTNALGRASYSSEAWQQLRLKTYGQALLLVCVISGMQMVTSYI